MCLIAFAIGASARWPLVIAANRDEFLNRPTLPLARWYTDAGKEIISGRDQRAGGTWLGVSPDGRVAMLTNVREPQPSTGERSRGELVTRWLEGDMDAGQFMAQTQSAAYGAFNLVLGNFQTSAWHWLTNRIDERGWHSHALDPGIYGLSNSALDTPWPKTLALKQALASALATPDPDTLQTKLWSALQDRQRASTRKLPRTGVPLAQEHALSSAFVDFPEHGYGTRCSTVLVASTAPDRPVLTWDILVQETTHTRGASNSMLDTRYQLAWQQGALSSVQKRSKIS